MADWQSALARAREHSPFLARALERQPQLAALLERGEGETALALARQAGAGTSDVGVALRRERLAFATALAIGDLAGAFPLERVMGELSDLADRALDAAIGHAIARRTDEDPAGFVALALGKQGARELNYSSDIDPILLYDPETLPRRRSDEPGEAAQRYARDIVRLLSDNTEEGYVFRVDLRLRPASEVSPLAISLGAATTHYESSALAWERAAYIRARPAAGEVETGQAFLRTIQPFVWRRSLDFGAVEEIRRLTARIRTAHDGPAEPGPGYNVKHGRGGIREIEFFAQTHQLIHGGRNPSLRVRGTRAALDALRDAGLIDAEDASRLGESYDRLRVIEHRLQMIGDQQTHSLPGGDALDGVAQLDGLADGAAMIAELTQITQDVATRFDSLVDMDDQGSAPVLVHADPLAVRLKELGFPDPERDAGRIESWSDGRMRALRSDAARDAFAAILPHLLAALAEAPEPVRALNRLESILAALPSAINLFRLLEARPALLAQLVSVLTLAPTLADMLARRPNLFDALIDRSALDLPGEVEELAAAMMRADARRGYEGILDRIRVVTGETRFALGVQLIEAEHDPLAIAAALSRTAEAALQVALERTVDEFASVHGRIAGTDLAVLGLGRLGGGALTHASDLDIVYLFAGENADEVGAESDGERPLGTTLYFNRLAQRVGAALSVPTAEGALYEVDTRLRPQGAHGPLAVSLESFARYQREEAWTWEHMALCRARPLAGPPAARVAIRETIRAILLREREPETLRADVLRMRAEVAGHKSATGPLDVKLLRGGLVDSEFLVHFLQLRHRIALEPDFAKALPQLVDAGLLKPDFVAAYDLMSRVLVSARLLAPELARPSAAAARALADACGEADLEALLHSLGHARQEVARAWQTHFDRPLEIDA